MRTAPALALVLLAMLVATSLPTHATPVTPTFTNHPATRPLALDAGEPSLGVSWVTGSVFFQSGTTTYKVTFDDTLTPAKGTWRNAANTGALTTNLDPILFTDSASGRTWAGGLDGECSILGVTNDDGATWTRVTNPCTGVFDHETIGAGPFHEPAPQQALGDMQVYYCAQNSVQMCSVSWDGGKVWGPPTYLGRECVSYVGHVKVGPDGTAYVPARNCHDTLDVPAPSGLLPVGSPLDQHPGVAVSEDNGLTWRSSVANAIATGRDGFDPSVAVASDGTIYLAEQAADGTQRVVVSHDKALTWSAPVDVSTPAGLTATTFSAAVAGDGDRAAIAFLGTSDGGDAFATPTLVDSVTGAAITPYAGTWDLYVAFTYDGGATWTTVKASADAVQRGPICTKGTVCASGRNLLDFIDATVDAQGRVLVAYADGCIAKCATDGFVGGTALGTIARQSGGTCLFAARCA